MVSARAPHQTPTRPQVSYKCYRAFFAVLARSEYKISCKGFSCKNVRTDQNVVGTAARLECKVSLQNILARQMSRAIKMAPKLLKYQYNHQYAISIRTTYHPGSLLHVGVTYLEPPPKIHAASIRSIENWVSRKVKEDRPPLHTRSGPTKQKTRTHRKSVRSSIVRQKNPPQRSS